MYALCREAQFAREAVLQEPCHLVRWHVERSADPTRDTAANCMHP